MIRLGLLIALAAGLICDAISALAMQHIHSSRLDVRQCTRLRKWAGQLAEWNLTAKEQTCVSSTSSTARSSRTALARASSAVAVNNAGTYNDIGDCPEKEDEAELGNECREKGWTSAPSTDISVSSTARTRCECKGSSGYVLDKDGRSCELDNEQEGFPDFSLGFEVRSIAYSTADKTVFMATNMNSSEGEIGARKDGIFNVLRKNVTGISYVAGRLDAGQHLPHTGMNCFFFLEKFQLTRKTQNGIYPAHRPDISVCTREDFCHQIIAGQLADMKGGLALHPQAGRRVWVDSYKIVISYFYYGRELPPPARCISMTGKAACNFITWAADKLKTQPHAQNDHQPRVEA
ncbi:hypothetical protein WR25_09689 [Diploscapter pachys]|uniref:Uncharacterized protein n=1 Tax=Diploscapter pachys TaxID=2018661 RepID=A0A2A2K882_9BILA|nr:hypothetical protein WR25_09689 [Diploscapter pachys]